jgi:coniferyl-aldehyde dehydrogenase
MTVTELNTAESAGAGSTLLQAFEAHKAAASREPFPSYEARRANLERLRRAVLDRRDEIADAVIADYGSRSRHETVLAEVLGVTETIGYCLKHLRRWMRPQSRHIELHWLPGSGTIVPQPLGVIGIIAPWNYPVNLCLAPAVYALAAGNRVMLKPSELTPRTADVIHDLIDALFPSDLISVHRGGVEVGIAFSKVPFDHLLYTGSTSVGRHILRAAADNLTPVTLELGGKSPVIIHEAHSIKHAAERICNAKLFNAGQTCIAPDYVLVHPSQLDAFVSCFQEEAAKKYATLANNPDYTSIINAQHKSRLEAYLADASEKGAEITDVNPAGESFEEAGNKLMPRLVRNVSDDMVIMQDEIFGPLLPVVPVDSLDDAIAYVNARPRPLALYYFDFNASRQKSVIERTHAGGMSVNDCLWHYAQDDLPFGGIGPSGMGAYHGKEGFETFSHHKSVFTQGRLSGTWLMSPPYGRFLERFMSLFLR